MHVRVAIWPFLKLTQNLNGLAIWLSLNVDKKYILRPVLDKSEQISNIL